MKMYFCISQPVRFAFNYLLSKSKTLSHLLIYIVKFLQKNKGA